LAIDADLKLKKPFAGYHSDYDVIDLVEVYDKKAKRITKEL
jgi:hypothetical protein